MATADKVTVTELKVAVMFDGIMHEMVRGATGAWTTVCPQLAAAESVLQAPVFASELATVQRVFEAAVRQVQKPTVNTLRGG